MSDKTDRIIKISTALGGGLTAFTGLLYLVGRIYSQSYFAALGIPNNIMDYNFVDYAFIGAKWHNLIIVLLFTSVVIGLLFFVFIPSISNSRKKVSFWDKFSGFGYFVWFVITLIITTFMLSFCQPNKFITSLLFIFPLIAACWFLIILSEKRLTSYIKRDKVKSKIFIIAALITIILFPYTCSTGWGTFSGILELDKNPYGYTLIELTANRKLINDIQWESISDGTLYKTKEGLNLIASNHKYIIFRSINESDNLYIINVQDIITMSVVRPISKVYNSDNTSGLP